MQVRDLIRRIRMHYRCEWAWAVEVNPKRTGQHLHAIQHGDFLPQRHLQELWGGRICHITRVKKTATGYLTKVAQVCGYLTKEFDKHLKVNGGRAIHLSRGFLHGFTSREVQQVLSSDRQWHLEIGSLQEISNAQTQQSNSQIASRENESNEKSDNAN